MPVAFRAAGRAAMGLPARSWTAPWPMSGSRDVPRPTTVHDSFPVRKSSKKRPLRWNHRDVRQIYYFVADWSFVAVLAAMGKSRVL
ncbi:MAG: hypothetical protein F4W68_01690 [Cenarchaeum sp. SB0661_bin_35]|nr:hypothetical protein [Cenarchaeum sp. SB0666_bin_15]MYC79201.1 hypothetical protein [Cenarchaeum sp. SB0661_bin_35]